jgi:rare lipoprotein A
MIRLASRALSATALAATLWRALGVLAAALALAACGSAARKDAPIAGEPQASAAGSGLPCIVPSPTLKKGGAYYLDDGPGSNHPPNLSEVPDAEPRLEPLRESNMKPYVALGRRYTPMTELRHYKARGLASWYGRRYHGQKTASGEIYDMYAMTAAHPTLPIPSYVRVTNVSTGRSVVVRVNDRGPFHPDRVIDLSFTAACKLELVSGGSGLVEVETIIPGEPPPAEVAGMARPVPPHAIPVTSRPEADMNGAPAVSATEREDLLATLSQAEQPLPPGVYLQLGAFGARENADNFLAHLRGRLSWMEAALSLTEKDGLYRVEAGPYPSAQEARLSAERVARTVGFKPLLTSR